MLVAIALAALACALPEVHAQTAADRDAEFRAALALIEARLAAEQRERRIPGMSAAVVYDQEIVWSKGFGYADLETRTPATPQTVYRIASITKLFTATMLMQLRDAGVIGLGDPVAKHLPGYRLASRFEDSPEVNLLQLATHTAGFPREAPMEYWRTLEFPSFDAMLEAVATKGERVFLPYTEWKYSNIGYSIFGEALARASGKPYMEYVQRRIVEPLGMKTTGFSLTPAMKRSLATGYFKAKQGEPPRPAPQPDYNGYAPATSLYSTVEDIARFISLQFREGSAGGTMVLRGSSLREMRAAHWIAPNWNSGWGIGFAINRVADHAAIGHGGAIQGFATNIMLIADLKMGVAIFTNTNTDPEEMARATLEILAPVAKRLQERSRPRLDPAPPQWRAYLGIYGNPFGRLQVRIHDNMLQVVSLDYPQSKPIELTSEGEHQFRMKGGFSSGELARFEFDVKDPHSAASVWVGQFPFDRIP